MAILQKAIQGNGKSGVTIGVICRKLAIEINEGIAIAALKPEKNGFLPPFHGNMEPFAIDIDTAIPISGVSPIGAFGMSRVLQHGVMRQRYRFRPGGDIPYHGKGIGFLPCQPPLVEKRLFHRFLLLSLQAWINIIRSMQIFSTRAGAAFALGLRHKSLPSTGVCQTWRTGGMTGECASGRKYAPTSNGIAADGLPRSHKGVCENYATGTQALGSTSSHIRGASASK